MYELSVLENFSLLELNSGLSNADPVTKPFLHKRTKWCRQLNTLSLISPGSGGQRVQDTLFSCILPFAVPVSLSFILDLSSCCTCLLPTPVHSKPLPVTCPLFFLCISSPDLLQRTLREGLVKVARNYSTRQ